MSTTETTDTSEDATPAGGHAQDAAYAIFERATQRARQGNLPYAGAVTPAEAFRLQQLEEAVIVDVRTRAEWEFVGRVARAPLIEWRAWGATEPNPDFVAELGSRVPPQRTVLFLCRSGVRSHHAAAAATRAGYARAMNILEGFEGDLGPDGRRGHAGWRCAGLPWNQG